MKKVISGLVAVAFILSGLSISGGKTSADNPTVTMQSSFELSNSLVAGGANIFQTAIAGANQNQNVLIDLELYNSAGNKVKQAFADNQLIPADGVKLYQLDAPKLPADSYHFSVGIFNPGWNGMIHWYDSVQTFLVTGSGAATVPTITAADPIVLDPSGVSQQASDNGVAMLTLHFRNSDMSTHHLATVHVRITDSGGRIWADQTWANMDFTFGQIGSLTAVQPVGLVPGSYTFSAEVTYPDSAVDHIYRNLGSFTVH